MTKTPSHGYDECDRNVGWLHGDGRIGYAPRITRRISPDGVDEGGFDWSLKDQADTPKGNGRSAGV
ncbi:hypothetical protein BH23CHL4_BH23CHL4_08900 [soil metagenome]